jgi:CheY-like chemotaxis protein
VDVNALVGEFAQLLRRAAGETVVLEFDLAADPATSYADAAHFQSALLNLVINARDAMPAGGRMLISTRNGALDDGREAVVACVRDSGAGMSAEVAARAFEPFFTTKEVGRGSGLGLSQVYGFARQSGGQACIDSTPGTGTAVLLMLPARIAGARAEGANVARGAAAAPDAPVRVLLVEDDPAVLSTLSEQLLAVGWSVVAAQNGQAALDLLADDPAIDVLVTDVMMPGGMSGVELARLAARRRCGLPTLLISGYPGAALEAAGADGREFALLHKPFSQQALIERVLAAVAPQRAGSPPNQAVG